MTIPSLEIRELNGEERTIVLSGRAGLPSSLTFEGTHEIAESRSLGSPYTTQQPLGANEMPTTISGEWNDIFLSQGGVDVSEATTITIDGAEAITIDSTTIRTVREVVDVFDDMRKRGAVVRVSWNHLVRIGRISNFKHKWLTVHDVEWEATFKWIGQDEDTDVGPPADIDPSNDVRALNEAANAVCAATDYGSLRMDPTIIEVIDTRIARVQSGIDDLSDSIRTRVEGVTSAVDVFRRTIGVLNYAAAEAELLALEIDARVSGTWIANIDYEDMRNVKPGDFLVIQARNRAAAQLARHLSHEAIIRQNAAINSVEGVAEVIISREGDDLQSITQAVWGSPDAWTVIRDFNHFTSASLDPGTVVLIPQRGSRIS